MPSMDPELIGLIRQQRGVVRADQLADYLDASRLRAALRDGGLHRLRRGVYASAEAVALAQTPETRQRLLDEGVCLAIGIPLVRSHYSAARLHGLEVLRERRPRTHLTAAQPQSWRGKTDVVIHVAGFDESEVIEIDGIRCLDLPRTTLDLARLGPLTAGVVAMDSALRSGVRAHDLAASLERMHRWPGVRRARRAYALADDGAESVGETLSRLLVTELGHGTPETQFGLTDGFTTAYSDLRLGRHLIEFDGRVKYTGAYGPGAEVLWEEKKRQDFLMGFRLGMSRLVWDDLFSTRQATLQRVEREYQASCRAYGTAVDDLARFRVRRVRTSRTAA